MEIKTNESKLHAMMKKGPATASRPRASTPLLPPGPPTPPRTPNRHPISTEQGPASHRAGPSGIKGEGHEHYP